MKKTLFLIIVIALSFGAYAQSELHETISPQLTKVKTIAHTFIDGPNQERILTYIQVDKKKGYFLLHDQNPGVMTVKQLEMPDFLIVNEFDICQDSIFIVGDSAGCPFFGSFSVVNIGIPNVNLNIRWMPNYALPAPPEQQYVDYLSYCNLERVRMYNDKAAGVRHVLMIGSRVLDRYNPGILPNSHWYDTVGCLLDFNVENQSLLVGYFDHMSSPCHKEELDDLTITENYVVVAGRTVYNNHKFDTAVLRYYDRNNFSIYNRRRFRINNSGEILILSNLRIDSIDYMSHPDAIVIAHYSYHSGTQSSGMSVSLAYPYPNNTLPPVFSNAYQPQTTNSIYNIFQRYTVRGIVWEPYDHTTYVLQNSLGLDAIAPVPNTAIVRIPLLTNGAVIWHNDSYFTSLDRKSGHSYLAGGIDYTFIVPVLWRGQYSSQCGMELAMPMQNFSAQDIEYYDSDVVYEEFCPKRKYSMPSYFNNRTINCSY